MRKLSLLDTLTTVMTLLALVGVVLFVRRQYYSPLPTPGAPPTPVEVLNWEAFDDHGQRIGPESALVTIVEFADYQCPYCAKFAESFRTLAKKYDTQIALVYRHFPMASLHPHATDAAKASLCAGRQERFEQLYDFVYTWQDSIGILAWDSIASRVAVPDLPAFNECMNGTSVLSDLARDSSAAAALGVNATPTVLVNNMKIPGHPGTKGLDSLIAMALAARSNLP